MSKSLLLLVFEGSVFSTFLSFCESHFQYFLHEDKLSLSDFVDFGNQLASAGYVLKVGNNVNYLRLGFEKPTLGDLLKRFVVFVTRKKIVLTQAQKFIFSKSEKSRELIYAKRTQI